MRSFAPTKATLGLVFLLAGSPAHSETLECSGITINFDAEYRELADATCDAVTEAKFLMAECDLIQREHFDIVISESARHPAYGDCLGYYDSRSGCLEVTRPEKYTELFSEGDARALLSESAVYASVVVHEVAHAFLEQTEHAQRLSPAEHEFVASVFEMASFDPEQRAILLREDPVKTAGSLDLVHPAIYTLAPRAFANNAWNLFQREEYGCQMIQRIVSGEFQFPKH